MVRVVDFGGKFSNFPSYLAIDMDKALAAAMRPATEEEEVTDAADQ